MLTIGADFEEDAGDADAAAWMSGACWHLRFVDEVHNVHLERVVYAKHHVLACCARQGEHTSSNSSMQFGREAMWIIAVFRQLKCEG